MGSQRVRHDWVTNTTTTHSLGCIPFRWLFYYWQFVPLISLTYFTHFPISPPTPSASHLFVLCLSESVSSFAIFFFFILPMWYIIEYLAFSNHQSWVFIGRTNAEAETPILWPTHAKSWLIGKDWCWEGLWAGGEGDNRGWDGWMASLTRWMWVWVNSGSWWWTGRPGVLRFMGSQRVGHDWVTDLIWTVFLLAFLRILSLYINSIVTSAIHECFTFSFPIRCLLFFLPKCCGLDFQCYINYENESESVNMLSQIRLEYPQLSAHSGHSCLVPDPTEKDFSFWPLSIILAVGLSYMGLLCWNTSRLYPFCWMF